MRHAEACYALRSCSLPKLTDDHYHVHVAAVDGLKLDWTLGATMAAFVREFEANMLSRMGLVGALKMLSRDGDQFDFRAPTLGGMNLERDLEAASIAQVLVERWILLALKGVIALGDKCVVEERLCDDSLLEVTAKFLAAIVQVREHIDKLRNTASVDNPAELANSLAGLLPLFDSSPSGDITAPPAVAALETSANSDVPP